MKYELGLSSCGKELNDKLFCAYKENGITKMELSKLSKSDYSQMDFREVEILAKKYGVQLWSLHLPFAPLTEIDISSTDEDLRISTIKKFKDLIEKGAQIGIKYFIVHPSGEPIEDVNRENKMRQAKKSLTQLAEIAADYNAVIVVENLPRTCLGNCSKEILELVSVDTRLRVCFDTNHLLGEKIEEFILAVGEKIITTHVSDYDAVNERHWLPGEGVIDWNNLIDALEKIGYKGPWLYEIDFGIPKTILRDRLLTCEDFARNAKHPEKSQIPGENFPKKTFCPGWSTKIRRKSF